MTDREKEKEAAFTARMALLNSIARAADTNSSASAKALAKAYKQLCDADFQNQIEPLQRGFGGGS